MFNPLNKDRNYGKSDELNTDQRRLELADAFDIS